MRKLSNTVASKEYVPGNYFTFEKFFTWEKFTLIFFCLTSILNAKSKCILVFITATVFLMAKGCSKIIIKMHLLELLQFCEVFAFVVYL